MINYIGRVMQKTGDAVVGLASSSLVKGASKLGTGVLKLGVEAGAGILDTGINGIRKAAPKLKNINKQKISDGIGKVANKTLVGVGDDYKALGKVFNDSKPGKVINNMVGENIIDDASTIRLSGARKKSNRPKTTYTASKETFGLADALGDRVKTYADGITHVVKGDSFITGRKALLETGQDNLMPFGLKATKFGTKVAIGASLIAGTPQAVGQMNKNRQGMNYDSQPVSLAPTTPAYSNNGGATGDLVFALNNLRHGGMM